MTENEIAREYRLAKDKIEQIQILADLNATDQDEILDILVRHGENVRIPLPTSGKKPEHDLSDKEYMERLFKYMDTLNAKIVRLEKQYRKCLLVLQHGGLDVS